MRLNIRFYKAYGHRWGGGKMIFDNAKLMSCSFLHQQHLKCASFVYSATEMEGGGVENSWEKSDVGVERLED